MKITSFKQLKSWQKGHDLVLVIYKTTSSFPKSETFGLTSQLRRAAVSITSNIAEGFGRTGKKDKQRFFQMSLGSLLEVENQIEIAKDINLINQKQYQEILNQINLVGKLTNGLILSTKRNYKNY